MTGVLRDWHSCIGTWSSMGMSTTSILFKGSLSSLVCYRDIDFRNTLLGVIRDGQVQTDFPVQPKTFFKEEIRFYYIDFDFSRRFENEVEARKLLYCQGGKYYHWAPELRIPGKSIAEIRCDLFKLDVWLLRMTLDVRTSLCISGFFRRYLMQTTLTYVVLLWRFDNKMVSGHHSSSTTEMRKPKRKAKRSGSSRAF